jgi:hypothetical protein
MTGTIFGSHKCLALSSYPGKVPLAGFWLAALAKWNNRGELVAF